MTTWVEPSGGRERGLRGLLQAWVQVLRHPVAFYRNTVSPGDQAPGLAFAMAVVGVTVALRIVIIYVDSVLGVATGLDAGTLPTLGGGFALSAFLVIAVYTLLVAPLSLHAIAAVETLLLVALLDDRGGVSETVQVIGYATAPCVLVGVPWPPVQLLATVYGSALLVIGTREIHETTTPRGLAVAAIPGILAFGYGFGGFQAIVSLFPGLADILPWVVQ